MASAQGPAKVPRRCRTLPQEQGLIRAYDALQAALEGGWRVNAVLEQRQG